MVAMKRPRDDDDDEPPQGRRPPSEIRNKKKRAEIVAKVQREKKWEKKKKLKKRREETQRAVELGEPVPARQVPITIDSAREKDETAVELEDDELQADDDHDEFGSYFDRSRTPKVLFTTGRHPTKVSYRFIQELMSVIPALHYYKRGAYHIKQIVKYASTRGFTALMVLNEDRKKLNGLLLMGLPEGPTAHFRLSSLVLRSKMKNHGAPTKHVPEVILNNFSSRLGHRVGRLLASLFPQDPEFRGRRVVTFHNQRDYIFFRHHRYIFDGLDESDSDGNEEASRAAAKRKGKPQKGEKNVTARLQECGPRFTLKLYSLQRGPFDSRFGEFEWVHKPDMDTSRRRFFL